MGNYPRNENSNINLATGYSEMAIKMSNHVNYYIPEGWSEPIQLVMCSVRFGKEDAKAFLEMFKEGILKQNLENYSGEFQTLTFKVVHDAIISFFKEGLYEESLKTVDENELISNKHILIRFN